MPDDAEQTQQIGYADVVAMLLSTCAHSGAIAQEWLDALWQHVEHRVRWTMVVAVLAEQKVA